MLLNYVFYKMFMHSPPQISLNVYASEYMCMKHKYKSKFLYLRKCNEKQCYIYSVNYIMTGVTELMGFVI